MLPSMYILQCTQVRTIVALPSICSAHRSALQLHSTIYTAMHISEYIVKFHSTIQTAMHIGEYCSIVAFNQLLMSVTSEKNKQRLHSKPVFLCYYIIPELRGRSPVVNIVLSLQVVHRADYWSQFDAAPPRTPDSQLLSTATQTHCKSYLCIPFLGIARPQSQFPHSCVCERFIYSQDRSTYFLQPNWQIDRGNIYLYVYFLILQNIFKLLFTLYSLLIQNLALVKISCPSLLVKEQGLGLYSDPTPIYLFVYPTIIPLTNGDR